MGYNAASSSFFSLPFSLLSLVCLRLLLWQNFVAHLDNKLSKSTYFHCSPRQKVVLAVPTTNQVKHPVSQMCWGKKNQHLRWPFATCEDTLTGSKNETDAGILKDGAKRSQGRNVL